MIGLEKGAEAANWVEKCSCPKSYDGDNSEEAPGFKHEPANGGPYSACIPCDCNGHAHICATGHATGQKCKVCADGHFGGPRGQFGLSRECEECQCNGNVDLNVVKICNQISGAFLKCIYNTAAEDCDKFMSGTCCSR